METFISDDSRKEIDEFNKYVSDFNDRCASFRYKGNALQVIQAEINKEGRRLQAEGAERAIALRTSASKWEELVAPPTVSSMPAGANKTPSSKPPAAPEKWEDIASVVPAPPVAPPSQEQLEQQALERARELMAAKDYNKAIAALSLYRDRPNTKALIEKIKEEQFRLLRDGTEVSATSKPF